ncbi:hypothetical protein AVEN_230221-1 [Araneus ventricosus]|uniref:Uncharacterized protein n=1 Tax=Araneus ventricosus TaxID=182803 RepID=A0A4Y2DYD7_ARAVE|nr:hypothetical protein AVEN_230221-1 [Araneus ventricosus]
MITQTRQLGRRMKLKFGMRSLHRVTTRPDFKLKSGLVSGSSKCPDLASECDEREIWLQLRKSDAFEKSGIVPPMKENSVFTPIVDEKVGEPPYPDPSSN